MLLLIIWKGYDLGNSQPPRCTYEQCIWMLQCLSQCGAKVILALVSKAEGNTKVVAIHLREVYFRMVVVCNICQSFHWHEHRASWATILDVMPITTRNIWNRRDRKRQKTHTRRSPGPGDERRHPNYPAQRSTRSHKELKMQLGPLPESFWIIPSSLFRWVLTQSDKLSFLSSVTMFVM